MKFSKPLSVLFLLLLFFTVAYAQDQPATTQPSPADVEKQKEEWTKNAYRLLDQVVDEAQSLKLAENRIRIEINAADMLWDRDQSRARSMFQLASDAVADMMRSTDTTNNRQGPGPNQGRRPAQLRQELVLSAARHDAPLAYQLLAATKPPPSPTPAPTDTRNPRTIPIMDEDNLEQNLLAQVAALDPKLAAQNADQMLEEGQFPRSLTAVISQLQRQDAEAARKLATKTVSRLQTTNLLSNNEADTLALGLLMGGPRVAAASTSTSDTTTATTTSTATTTPAPQRQGSPSVLEQSAYTDLMNTVIDSALKAAPSPTAQRGANAQGRGPGRQAIVVTPNRNDPQAQPTDAQIEQNNARGLMMGLRMMLPNIDTYLPSRTSAVRAKMTELGIGDVQRASFGQTLQALGQDATPENMLKAAATAPAQLQPRWYQQAANMALDQGNTDLARQIANDHLQGTAHDSLLQRIDIIDLVKKADNARIDDIRPNLARLRTDGERIDLLIQMAGDLKDKNPKLARQLLDEARNMTNRRAVSYDQFEQQLKVANAFATVDPSRSFEVLDPGISQLNELLNAASVLSGFEVNIFRDGELPLQGGNGLTSMLNRYGEELAQLARTDFQRSETLAGRFQLAEPRILARLSIVQGLLGVQPVQPNMNVFRGFGQNFNFSFNFRSDN